MMSFQLPKHLIIILRGLCDVVRVAVLSGVETFCTYEFFARFACAGEKHVLGHGAFAIRLYERRLHRYE